MMTSKIDIFQFSFPPLFHYLSSALKFSLLVLPSRMEDDEATIGARKSSCKDSARLFLSMAMMILLVWVVHTGYKLATQATREAEREGHNQRDNYIILLFGVVTVVFGSVYFIVGVTILLELALDLSARFLARNMETTNDQGKEEKTIWQLITQISVTISSTLMLTWAIHHGCKLAVEAPKGGIHNGLAFLIGFIAMGFGCVYFVIGIGVIAESVLYLTRRLQEVAQSDVYENRDTNVYLPV